MPHSVPDLGYAFDALEPHIDARTMEIHHDKHHAAYVTNLNAALEGTGLEEMPVSGAAMRDGVVELAADSPTRALHELASWAIARGVELERLQVSRPSLEDVYLELTGGD